MRTSTEIKLKGIHDGVLKYHDGRVQLLTIILTAGHFINYYIEKGEILESERDDAFEYIASYVFNRYKPPFPGAKDGWVMFMEDLNGQYDKNVITKYNSLIK
ncbi:MAG TPA: hypothetical protein PLJ19_01220 [Dysgonamonadaceae bacterium]|nr:hypothetical protein [Dysgonamonadaceae bacterium]